MNKLTRAEFEKLYEGIVNLFYLVSLRRPTTQLRALEILKI